MTRPGLVVVGASWGGFDALAELLDGLPRPLPVPLVAVLHRGPRTAAASDLPLLLSRRTGRPVVEPDDKERLVDGTIYVAPADYHLLVDDEGLGLSTEEAVHHNRPAVDVTLQTAADRYGSGLVGVVLTGANTDGAAGTRRVSERGGRTMVQDPVSAVRPEMPRAALATGAVHDVGTVAELAARLTALLSRGVS